ncbi:MAG: hypothetical protein R3C01_03400 [Planctomycetaceae bacterium]
MNRSPDEPPCFNFAMAMPCHHAPADATSLVKHIPDRSPCPSKP